LKEGNEMIKIGITYLYTIFKYGYPPRINDDMKALSSIAAMGFHYLEMEGLGEEHSENIWKRREEYKNCLEENRIHVHNFCIVDPALVSFNKTDREHAYERFERTIQLGNYLGTETFHLASYAPPISYIGDTPYKLGAKGYKFGDRFEISIPDDFSWPEVWSVLVESCKFSAGVAAKYGKTIIMEPRVGEIICSVDSMLRLIDDVGMPNFKANFDTGHFSAQRENVPLALMKLRGKFANIHIADNDPVNPVHLPIGDGTIDWHEFFRILRKIGYEGYLGIDLGGKETIEQDLIRSREFVIDAARQAGIEVEW
jgi:sugar phosphate isomerase/epimerase